MSFLRQVEVTKDKGYKDNAIIDGNIRAIQTGSGLRGFSQEREHLDLPVAQAIIRSFYIE